MRRRGRPLALVAAIAVGVAALGVLAYATDTFRRLELDTVDARFAIRGERAPPRELLLVLIDDRTTSALREERFPFRRRLHARVVDAIRAGGAKAIAVDIQFTEPTTTRDDNALVRAVARARGRVVLSTTQTDGRGGTRIFGGDEVLRRIGARAGSTVYRTDPGAVFRRATYAIDGLQTFGLVAAEIAGGRRIDPDDLGGDSAWIDFAGPPETIPAVSYVDVLRGRAPPERFRGKTVVVGASDISLQDVHAASTTGDELMAGPEIQANVVATALAGFPLQDAPGAVGVLAICALAALVPLACLRLSPLRSAAVGVAGGLLFTVAVQLAFNAGTIVPFTYPLAALVLSAALALAAQGSLAAIERGRVRDVFARFVPDAVVDEVLERTDDDLRLGAERRVATVMFTDLRGFTAFAELREPDETIEVLNRYLNEMADAIMAHGGTLVSFMGDGIMAVFGLPLEQPDHADRALAATREMLGPRLEGVNAWLRETGICDGFAMGVGLNSGPVMSGNVGSERRMEYTAIGDTTNTAARLEGATKGSPYAAYVADSTRALLTGGADGLEDAGALELRGRTQALRVWGLR